MIKPSGPSRLCIAALLGLLDLINSDQDQRERKRIMGYIEVWAKYTADSKPVPTKKALRDALSQDLASVTFSSVGGLNAPFNGHVGNIADEQTTLTVCGPDPFTRRNWWANLKMIDGKVFMDDKAIKSATS